MSDQSKSLVEALQSFAKQFGDDDEHNRVLIEILLEELMSSSRLNYSKEKRDGD